MGFFSGFKDKAALAVAKADYEKCSAHRTQQRAEFRKNLVNAFGLQVKDAVFLLNTMSPFFMIWSPSQNMLAAGQFADSYQVYLDFVPFDATTAAVQKVVFEYQRSVQRAHGIICDTRFQEFAARAAARKLSDSHRDLFKNNGLIISAAAEPGQVYGAALFLNDKQIARSTCLEPKRLGYFADQLFEHALLRRNVSGKGSSYLYLAISVSQPGHGPEVFYYQLVFDDRVDYSTADSNNRYKLSLDNLRDFLYELEFKILNEPRAFTFSAPQETLDGDLDNPMPPTRESGRAPVYFF